jgi:hypothetical protein
MGTYVQVPPDSTGKKIETLEWTDGANTVERQVIAQGGGLVTTLLSAGTATGAGTAATPRGTKRTFQAVGTTSSGTGAATVQVQVSNDNTNWLTLGTMSLSLSTTATTDGFASDAVWPFVRGNVTAISGTGAAVTLTMGL